MSPRTPDSRYTGSSLTKRKSRDLFDCRCSLMLAAMAANLIAFVATSPRALAQNMVVEAAIAPAQPPDSLDEEEDVQAEPAMGMVRFQMNDDQFDQWVFGGNGGPWRPNSGTSKLDSLLNLQVEDLDRVCRLTESQKKKLLLAGRGDIKRFVDLVEEKRKKFNAVKNDQNKVGEIYQEIQPLQATLNGGLLGEKSLFAKTLKRALGEQQAVQHENRSLERRAFRYKAKIELAMSMMDQTLGLTGDQRQALIATILKETKPPPRFGQYDYYLVMWKISKIAEANLKPLLDDSQWRALNRNLAQARGLEQFLRSNGMLTDEDTALDVKSFVNALHAAPAPKSEKADLPADVFAPAPAPASDVIPAIPLRPAAAFTIIIQEARPAEKVEEAKPAPEPK